MMGGDATEMALVFLVSISRRIMRGPSATRWLVIGIAIFAYAIQLYTAVQQE